MQVINCPQYIAEDSVLHLKPFEHLINQILDFFLRQSLQLHQLPQICPHERHHQITSRRRKHDVCVDT